MTTYATIDRHSGYVWWMGQAANALEAAERSTLETGGDQCLYTTCTQDDAAASYDVHEVDEATSRLVDEIGGQYAPAIAAVEACPYVATVRKLHDGEGEAE